MSEPVRVRLSVTRQRTQGKTAIAGAIFVVAVLAAGAVAASVILWVAAIREPGYFRFGMAVFTTVAIGGGFVSLAYINLRTMGMLRRSHPAGEMLIGPDSMTITHEAVFERPVVLTASMITAVAVDASGSKWHPFTWARFPVLGEGGVVGCLWRARMPCPLPVAGVVREAPNMVLLFQGPLRFASATATGATLDAVELWARRANRENIESTAELRGAPPIDRSAAHHGLFLPVEDWDAARTALSAWPQFRDPLVAGDVVRVAGLLPLPAPALRFVTPAVVAYFGYLAVLLGGRIAGVEWPLFVPALLPAVLALNAYLGWHAWRAVRGAGRDMPLRARLGAVVGFLGIVAAAVLALRDLFAEG